MKLLFLLLIIITSVSCTEEIKSDTVNIEPILCDCNELILDVDYQRYYLTDKSVPFTGKCITLTPDSKKVFERNYLNGKYDGLVIVYHENGKVKSTTEYKKNLMSGSQKIYSDDETLISHAIYLRSQLKEIIK